MSRPERGASVYYPAYLKLTGRRAVVVGGGKVAERKVLALLKAGASVTVISPTLSARLEKEAAKASFLHVSRTYRKGDLSDAFLVIAATDSEETNRKVSEDSPCLVNVVDVPSECNFIAPSIVRRGALTIAISTSGVSPALAKAIRKELQRHFGPDFADYLKFLKVIRKRALSEITSRSGRETFLKGLGSERVLKELREEGLQGVKREVLKRLEKLGRTS